MDAKSIALDTIQNGYYGGEMGVEEVMGALRNQVQDIPDASHENCDAAIERLRNLIVELDTTCDRNVRGTMGRYEFEDRVTSLANRLMQALPTPRD